MASSAYTAAPRLSPAPANEPAANLEVSLSTPAKKREVARPWVRRVESALAAVVVMIFRVGATAEVVRKVTPLSSAQQSLRRGLGWSREVRALLEEVSATR